MKEYICLAMVMRWITSHGLGSQESGPLVMAGYLDGLRFTSH